MMILSSCTMFSQTQEKELDTTYLYFPFDVLFDYGKIELSIEEKQNLDYILEKYYYPFKDELSSDILLVALECPNETSGNNDILMRRLGSLFEYLVNEKEINRNNILMQIGGSPNPKICEDKAKQKVIIQYRRKPN